MRLVTSFDYSRTHSSATLNISNGYYLDASFAVNLFFFSHVLPISKKCHFKVFDKNVTFFWYYPKYYFCDLSTTVRYLISLIVSLYFLLNYRENSTLCYLNPWMFSVGLRMNSLNRLISILVYGKLKSNGYHCLIKYNLSCLLNKLFPVLSTCEEPRHRHILFHEHEIKYCN